MDFNKAIEHVRQIVEEKGFSVLLTKNLDDIFKKKLNIEHYPRYTIILACAPELAKGALDVSKNVGLLFPCSFAVYEEEGKIYIGHVSIMKIAAEIDLAPKEAMQPVIEMTGKRVHEVWDAI